jgi:hypothetical protein
MAERMLIQASRSGQAGAGSNELEFPPELHRASVNKSR